MGRREGPSEERRQAILEAAEAVFTDEGYHGASIREIARRAGVSSALLYWFFPNKAKLFAAVITARAESLGVLDFPPEILAIPPDVFLPRLAGGLMAALSQGAPPRLIKLVLREADREPEITQTLGQMVTGRMLGPLSGYLAQQMEQGRVRRADPDFVAQAFVGMLMLLVLRREVLQEPISRTWDVQEYAATAVRIFLDGALGGPGDAPIPAPGPGEAAPADGHERRPERIVVEE